MEASGGGREAEAQTGRGSGDFEVFERGQAPGGLLELRGSVGTEHSQNARPSGEARAYAGGGVFDDDAVCGGETEQFGAATVGLGVGLAAGDHVTGDEAFGDRQAGSLETHHEEAAGGGGDDSPAIRRETFEEGFDAGEDCEIFDVGYLEVFDLAETFGDSGFDPIRA